MTKFWIPGDLPDPPNNGRAKRGGLGPASTIYLGAIADAAKDPGRWGMIDRLFSYSTATSVASRLNNGHLKQSPVLGHPIYVHPKTGEEFLGLRHAVNAVVRPDSAGNDRHRVWIQVMA